MTGVATSRPWPNSGVAASLGQDAIFGPTSVGGKRLSIEARWTGTPTGTFSLECSFDGKLWRTVPGATAEFTKDGQAQPAGGAGDAVWNWINVPGKQLRLRYTRTSGTGSVTIIGSYGDQ